MLPDVPWTHFPTLYGLALALAIGLFVGLERERRGKEAGLRTFGFAGLLCGLGGLLGDTYAIFTLTFLVVLTGFLNWQAIRAGDGVELTTSAAMLLVGVAGVLSGRGETFTPVAVGVVTAALLSWKESLSGFSIGLTETELRSAILLAILAFIVYPVLPAGSIDPWNLIQPREAWVTVILIAAIGFVNYILLKMYGARGVALSGFLGGLVNSAVTVTELATRAREGGDALAGIAYRGVLLATAAMALRNLVILAILAMPTVAVAALPLGLIMVASLALSRVGAPSATTSGRDDPAIHLESPFSMKAALKFGLFFLALEVVGAVAQEWLGQWGFYAVSVIGGVVSSGSAVASAATLAAQGRMSADEAALGAVLASLASIVVNVWLVARVAGQPTLTGQLGRALAVVAGIGILGAVAQQMFVSQLVADLAASATTERQTPPPWSSKPG